MNSHFALSGRLRAVPLIFGRSEIKYLIQVNSPRRANDRLKTTLKSEKTKYVVTEIQER